MKSEMDFLEKGIMGNKRLKLARGFINFIPKSVNFSELEEKYPMDDSEFNYDPGDGGLEQDRLIDSIAYEELVIQILCNLEIREQLVFVYQLLRDGGYQIDHSSFAKTVHLTRRQFMRIVANVRQKTKLYILGYKQSQPETKQY